MNFEMLLAALTARPVRIDGKGRGGRVELTKDMIAASLSGLPKGAYYLIEAKFMGQEETEKALATSLLNQLTSDGHAMSKELNLAVCLAIREIIDPNTCQVCNGNPRIKLGSKEQVCHACDGSGVLKRTDTSRSQAVGVSMGEWLRMQGRFRDAQNKLSEWESMAVRRLLDNLKDEGVDLDQDGLY